jgi:hypothetical protein
MPWQINGLVMGTKQQQGNKHRRGGGSGAFGLAAIHQCIERYATIYYRATHMRYLMLTAKSSLQQLESRSRIAIAGHVLIGTTMLLLAPSQKHICGVALCSNPSL